MTKGDPGAVYSDRAQGGASNNVERAIASLKAGLPFLRTTSPPHAIEALVTMGILLRTVNRDDDAQSAWEEAMSLRERFLSVDKSAAERYQVAQLSFDLPIRLALLKVDHGHREAAVETLERGRAIALRETLALDDIWLTQLGEDERAPIVRARDALKNLRSTPPSAADGSGPARAKAWQSDIVAAETELDVALRNAEQGSGFRPPPPLSAAALSALGPEGGAVLLLAAGPEGGLICILPCRPGTSPLLIHTERLPQATHAAVRSLLLDWSGAYGQLKQALNKAITRHQWTSALLSANSVLEGVLDWLWDAVIGPILNHTDAVAMGVGPGAPLLLMPQGDLALLPLHAARGVTRGVRRAVLDDHVVSYAPSGAALQAARQRLAGLPSNGPHDLFGLFNPASSSGESLPATEKIMLPLLRALFGTRARVWSGKDATAARALSLNIKCATYVHFGCHGNFDGRDPGRSGLQLADRERLTVHQIASELRLRSNRWVALSACETAMVDVEHLPDEFIGLPAAFLQAGAAGVLATLWLVFDGPTAHLMKEVYRLHLDSHSLTNGLAPPSPAASLRDAVRWLRQQPNAALLVNSIEDDIFPINENSGSDRASPANATTPDFASLPIIWAAYSYHGA